MRVERLFLVRLSRQNSFSQRAVFFYRSKPVGPARYVVGNRNEIREARRASSGPDSRTCRRRVNNVTRAPLSLPAECQVAPSCPFYCVINSCFPLFLRFAGALAMQMRMRSFTAIHFDGQRRCGLRLRAGPLANYRRNEMTGRDSLFEWIIPLLEALKFAQRAAPLVMNERRERIFGVTCACFARPFEGQRGCSFSRTVLFFGFYERHGIFCLVIVACPDR